MTPLNVAVMTTGVAEFTVVVDTVNVALVTPLGTVTLPGTVAAPELLCRFTLAPPDSAGAERVTVPVTVLPPTTVFDERLTDVSTGVIFVGVPPQCHVSTVRATAATMTIELGLLI